MRVAGLKASEPPQQLRGNLLGTLHLFFLQQNILKIIYTPTVGRQVPSAFCHERRYFKLFLRIKAYHGIHAQLEHLKHQGGRERGRGD